MQKRIIRKLKCIIVDDEPIALRILKSYINKISYLEIIGECGTAVNAFEVLKQHHVDLMFLDINMSEMSGIDLLKSLDNPPQTIFTTAHSEYAVQGYELNAIDYLLKPISFERFLKAIDKAQTKAIPTIEYDKNDDTNAFAFIKANRKNIKLFYNDILFIESRGHYLHIKTTGDKLITLMKISEMEKQLPENQFIRAHRSFIVNLNKVTAYTFKSIELGPNRIPVGDNYRKLVLRTLNNTD